MIDIIYDSNVLVSKFDTSDKWFAQTQNIENALLYINNVNLIIPDICINEAINVICKRFESKNKLQEFNGVMDRINGDFPKNLIT